MSALQSAFLQAIRVAPDDDSQRLVYADWLDEHGDSERAEFIRVQCERAALAEDDPRSIPLTRREVELLHAHHDHWSEGTFLAWLEHPPDRCPIDQPHGVCEVFAEAARLRLAGADSDALEAMEPRIAPFNYRGYELHEPFFTSATFERGFLDRASVHEVLFFTFAPALRDLGMVRHLEILFDETEPMIGDAVLKQVRRLDAPRLLSLELGTMVTGLSGLRSLASWPGLSELRHLTGLTVWRRRATGPDDEAVRILARSRHLGKLEHLHLNLGHGYTDAALLALLDSPHLEALKKVQLYADHPRLSGAVLERFRARFGEWPDDRH